MTMLKIDYERLKKATDILYEAIDYSGIHYVELDTKCYDITRIKGVGSSMELPVEYLPVLALKLLMEFDHVKTTVEIIAKRFQEGKWE